MHPGSIPGEASNSKVLCCSCIKPGIRMIDFDKARQNMVDCQIRPNAVTDHAVIKAFLEVPREEFVSATQKSLAYIDEDLRVSGGEPERYLMEAMSMSKLVQLASIGPDDVVLDIGCATGYSTAILSRLCNSVVALESDEDLAEQATQNLLSLGYDNAAVVFGPLEKGYAKEGPYDAIFVGGAVDELPDTLSQQLKEGGRLVVAEGVGNAGVARVYALENGIIGARTAFNCAVRPLPGFAREESFIF